MAVRLNCSGCEKEIRLDVWPESNVVCPHCGRVLDLQKVGTYHLTDLGNVTPLPDLSPPTLSAPDAAPRPLTLPAGQTLPSGAQIGQYRVESLLGKGGMGAVYRAIHLHLQRPVALKVLPPELAKDPEFVKRFKREAQALARLQHPHIVAVHDMGIQGELYYFAMELVDGANLRQVLSTKSLSAEQALSLVPRLCEALEYAHAHGVVHRDIKPENILLDKTGAPKIADFGLAKIVKGESGVLALTQTNVVMGTADYMAPEQREATAKVDHRADIYALGVVVYEMLTGQLPMGRFDPPSRKVQVDVRIDDVVLKALAADPEQRYQHASHMGGDVTHVIATPAPARGPAPMAALVDAGDPARKLAEAARLAATPAPWEMPPFSWGTYVGWFLTLFGLLCIAIASQQLPSHNDGGYVAGITSLVLGAVFLLAFGIVDFTLLKPGHQRSPQAAVVAFFRSIKVRRHRWAYRALSPLARQDRSVTAPSHFAAQQPLRIRFTWLDGFKRYWKRVLRERPGYDGLDYEITDVERLSDSLAAVEVAGAIRIHESWSVWFAVIFFFFIGPFSLVFLFFGRKREPFTLRKMVARHGRRWYLLNGELSSDEDNALYREAKGMRR